MTEKSKKPRLRFKGFTEAWEQRKFEYWFTERNERSGEGELISVTINSGIKKFNELNRFDSKPEDMSKYKVVMIGDIAYNSMRMWQGASGLSPYNGILSPAYTVISPKFNADSKFFAFLIKKPELIHLFEINSQGLTKDTWNLKFPAFSQIEAAAPFDLDEQSKIATLLEQLDNLITLHQCKDFYFLKPENCNFICLEFVLKTPTWEQCKLGDMADIVGGGTPSTAISDYWDGDIDWYAPAEITGQVFVSKSHRRITQKGYNKSSAKMLPIGTVLFTSRAGIGKTAILAKEGCTNQGFQSIIPNSTRLDSYFIFSRTEELKAYAEIVGAGSTFVEVSGKQMAAMEIMMPKLLAEQVKIGRCFSVLDNLITLHQRVLINF